MAPRRKQTARKSVLLSVAQSRLLYSTRSEDACSSSSSSSVSSLSTANHDDTADNKPPPASKKVSTASKELNSSSHKPPSYRIWGPQYRTAHQSSVTKCEEERFVYGREADDVDCWTGDGEVYHPGNEKYAALVEARKIDFALALRPADKKKIFRAIRQGVGKFLTRGHGDFLMEMTPEEVTVKIRTDLSNMETLKRRLSRRMWRTWKEAEKKAREEIESSTSIRKPSSATGQIITKLKGNDVVCGQAGSYSYSNAGNLRFARLVQYKRAEYFQASRKQKSELISDIIRRCGRFVTPVGSWSTYVEIDSIKARRKIANLFTRRGSPQASNDQVAQNISKRSSTPGHQSQTLNVEEGDVMCGKSYAARSHPGNLRYHALTRERRLDYIGASTDAERDRIVAGVQGSFARFLIPADKSGVYIEMDPSSVDTKLRLALGKKSRLSGSQKEELRKRQTQKLPRFAGLKRKETTSFPPRKRQKTSSKSEGKQRPGPSLSVPSSLKPSPDIELVKVGSRVAVWWSGERMFFEGTVTQSSRSDRKEVRIEYDDGDTQWIDLRQSIFRLLSRRTENEGSSSSSDSDGDVATPARRKRQSVASLPSPNAAKRQPAASLPSSDRIKRSSQADESKQRPVASLPSLNRKKRSSQAEKARVKTPPRARSRSLHVAGAQPPSARSPVPVTVERSRTGGVQSVSANPMSFQEALDEYAKTKERVGDPLFADVEDLIQQRLDHLKQIIGSRVLE